MQYPLIQFEQYLEEAKLVSGELLFESGGVHRLSEIEKHLWLAEIQAEASWEAEISISPSKVIQTSCECAVFKAEKMCPHVVAALFALRKHLSDKKQQKAPSQAKAKSSLNTGNILAHISEEELKAFVSLYARHNRNFAVALKTRFAQDIPVADNQAKFFELLDSAISLARKPDRSFGQRGIKKIIQLLQEIHQQIHRALALSHFTDAADMAISIIEKISPLMRKAGDMQDDLKKMVVDTFDFLFVLIGKDISPGLRDAIWHYALESSLKLVHRNNQSDVLLFKLMSELAIVPDMVHLLSAQLDQQLYKYQTEGRNAAGLVFIQLQLKEKQGEHQEAGLLVRQYLHHPEVLMFVIAQALAKDDWHQVVTLAEEGLRMGMSPPIQHELHDLLIQASIREHNFSKTYELALKRFLSRLDMKYYDIASTALGDAWKDQPDVILQKLHQLPYSVQKRNAIAGVLLTESRYPALLDYLQQAKSLDLAVAYGTALPPEYRQALQQLMLEFIGQFLRGHAGPKPSQYIRELLDKLKQQGARELAFGLARQLKKLYPERHTLQEELQQY